MTGMLFVMASAAFAAETFTLWTNQTFSAPFVNGTVAVSNEVTNNSGLQSLEMIIEYQYLNPDLDSGPTSYILQAIVEGNNGANWYPLAYQFSHMNRVSNGPKRIIILMPNAPDVNGVDNDLYVGDSVVARQSFNKGVLTDKFRVRLTVKQDGAADLQAVTVSAYGRKF